MLLMALAVLLAIAAVRDIRQPQPTIKSRVKEMIDLSVEKHIREYHSE